MMHFWNFENERTPVFFPPPLWERAGGGAQLSQQQTRSVRSLARLRLAKKFSKKTHWLSPHPTPLPKGEGIPSEEIDEPACRGLLSGLRLRVPRRQYLSFAFSGDARALLRLPI